MGTGVMIGAGVFALTGQVAQAAGKWLPVAFLVAAVVVATTAYSDVRLSNTFPWGGGTLSSSDGLRLPIRGQSLTARSLSRYFVDQGGTSYTHVSDQHTTYGTQMIVGQ